MTDTSNASKSPKPPQDDPPLQLSPRPFDYVVFGAALLILAVVLWRGWEMPGVGSVVVYFVVLALACAMVFAYLPFHAQLNLPWFRAGGTAAVFGVCLLMTMPIAKQQQVDTASGKTIGQHLSQAKNSLSLVQGALAKSQGSARGAEGNLHSPQSCVDLAKDSRSQIEVAQSLVGQTESSIKHAESMLPK